MRACAKVNIFLKITGTRGDYHEILSRFMRVDTLYDTLEFIPGKIDGFELYGEFDCSVEQNTLYKAYRALIEATGSRKIEPFFASHALRVDKRIPAFAGLGGGSSDAAALLRMCNETLSLGLTTQELAQIGMRVGADVPFFVYDLPSANVSGIGEIVEPFDEPALNLLTRTPPVRISTPAVYREYRAHFFDPIDAQTQERLRSLPSADALERMTPEAANDLFAPARALYPELESYREPGWFFSGSGSSFFTLANAGQTGRQ